MCFPQCVCAPGPHPPSYLLGHRGPCVVGHQAWRSLRDVGLLRGRGLVAGLSLRSAQVAGLAPPGVLPPSVAVVSIARLQRHRCEARLWRPVGKVGPPGLSRHVLHRDGPSCLLLLRRQLPVLLLGRGVLRPWLCRPHLHVEGGLAGDGGRGVRGRDRLRGGRRALEQVLGHGAGGGWGASGGRRRALGFRGGLLGGGQRRLRGDDHALVAGHRSSGNGAGDSRAGVLEEMKNTEGVHM